MPNTTYGTPYVQSSDLVSGYPSASLSLANRLDAVAYSGNGLNAQTGTTYTLVLTDAGKTITLSNAAAVTLTVPTNASVAFPTNTVVTVVNRGAGTVTISGAGVTFQPSGNITLATDEVAVLQKVATDTWQRIDGLAAKAPLASPTFTGQAAFPDGSASAPSVAHTGDLNCGLYFPAADNVSLSTAGTERVNVNSDGNLGVGGGAGSTVRLFVKGSGTTNAASALACDNSAGTRLFDVLNDGTARSAKWYSTTTGLAANVYVNTDGSLLRSTSSLKYKTEVKDATAAEQDALITSLRPVTYKSLSDIDDPDTRFWGFIAEEVEEIDPRLVTHGEDGSPEGVQYDRIIPALVGYIQRLEARIAVLEAS